MIGVGLFLGASRCKTGGSAVRNRILSLRHPAMRSLAQNYRECRLESCWTRELLVWNMNHGP